MSRDRQKKSTPIRSRKPQPDPYTARIKKTPSKRELDTTLRHAVQHHDFDALEDYDEDNLRPPTGAVVLQPETNPIENQDSDLDDWYEGDEN